MKNLKLILIAVMATVCSTEAWADAVGNTFSATSSGKTLYYRITSISPRRVEVYSADKTSGSLTIPSSVSNSGYSYSVTRIANSAFYNWSSMTSVSIPSSVTEIGDYAFYNCDGLTSVTIPSSVTTIGTYVFYDCNGLTSVTINGNSLTSINSYDFYSCDKLSSINIPSSVTAIGYCAFRQCKSLTQFPSGGSGLKEIGDNAFQRCDGLQTVKLPNNVSKIGSYAFSYVSALTTFSGGNSLTEIGNDAFYYSSNLTTVTLPQTLKSIGSYAFYSYPSSSLSTVSGLSNVEYVGGSAFSNTPWLSALPDGQIYIGKAFYTYKGTMPEGTVMSFKDGTTCITSYALSSKSGLAAVSIPSSVNSIGDGVFGYCRNLTSITVASGNSYYDSRNNCNAIIRKADNALVEGCTTTAIPNTVKTISADAMRGNDMTSLTIPDAVDSIGTNAFSGCYKLKTLTVGKGVRKIVGWAFDYCFNLQDIIVSTSNPYFDSRNNCKGIIEKSTNTLRVACGKTVIPQNVKTIGQYAYTTMENGTVQTFTIPSHIETIEYNAFYGLPLRSVTIGKNVKSIGSNAFYCSSLRVVRSLVDFPSEINNYAFHNDVYENGTLYVPIGTTANYKATAGWNKFKNIKEVADGTIIDDDVVSTNTTEGVQLYFQVTSAAAKTCEVVGCATGVTGTVTIPSTVNGMSVTSIGYRAFYEGNYQHEISGVVIPNSITTIGNSAFYYCDVLTSVQLPATITSIGNYAFYHCDKIPSINLPSSLRTIGNYAFGYCEDATVTSLPNGLQSIGRWAFVGCKGSTSLTIPASVTSIGGAAFCNWTNLASITVAAGNSVYSSPSGCNAIIETASHTLVQGCKNTVIPSNVETIGYGAFNSHENLTSITLPSSLVIIDTLAFNNTGLTSITIPASVRVINNSAFRYCDNLTSITSEIKTPLGIPDDVFSHRAEVADPYEAATLYVPYGTRQQYMETDGWKNFAHIVELEGGQVKGDVNNDKLVDGVDLVALVNIILEKIAKTSGADVNGDGKVNGVDFVALVNIVLGRSNARMTEPAAAGSADIYIEPFSIKAGGTCDMAVGLNNTDADVTLMQFDLHLPAGLKVKTDGDGYVMDMAGRTSWRTHSLNANATDGAVRFLLSSTSNALIEGTDGAVMRLTLEADESFQGGVVELRDVLSVSPDMQQWRTSLYRYVIGSGEQSGVNNLTATPTGATDVYSLSGQRRSSLKKGVNIVGGRKVIVK